MENVNTRRQFSFNRAYFIVILLIGSLASLLLPRIITQSSSYSWSDVIFRHQVTANDSGSSWHNDPPSSDEWDELVELKSCGFRLDCIKPRLMLTTDVKVHLCPESRDQGVRFKMLVKEGLRLHPHVIQVNSVNESDVVLWSPVMTPPEANHPSDCWTAALEQGKLVVLDESDPDNIFGIHQVGGKNYKAIFKRSFVHKRAQIGVFQSEIDQVRDLYPLTYSILREGYLNKQLNMTEDRPHDVLASLRPHSNQQARQMTMNILLNLKQSDANFTGLDMTIGEVDHGGRKELSNTYFDRLQATKIIVNTMPTAWEGDFRLWESFASGALVFSDPLFVPLPYPPIHNRHVIFFDHRNPLDLRSKLLHYLHHGNDSRRIGQAGCVHALRYHSSVNMIDYILTSIDDDIDDDYVVDDVDDIRRDVNGTNFNFFPSHVSSSYQQHHPHAYTGKHLIQSMVRNTERQRALFVHLSLSYFISKLSATDTKLNATINSAALKYLRQTLDPPYVIPVWNGGELSQGYSMEQLQAIYTGDMSGLKNYDDVMIAEFKRKQLEASLQKAVVLFR